MSITGNISVAQGLGAGNASQSQTFGKTPKDLLGFIEALLHQSGAAKGADKISLPAENAPPGARKLSEKIAEELKKQGLSAEDLRKMPAEELTQKISELLEQQKIVLPPELQALPKEELAAKLAELVQKSAHAADAAAIKPSLTRDLAAPQSSAIQDTRTKGEIAQEITKLLESRPQGEALDAEMLEQLKTQLAQLQSAPGTLDPATLEQLTVDISAALADQGIPQPAVAEITAKLSLMLQKEEAAAAAPAPLPAAEANAKQIAENVLFPAHKPAIVTGGKNNAAAAASPGNNTAASTIPAAPAAPEQPLKGGVTAKVSGLDMNAAMVSSLAGGDGSGSAGFGDSGFSFQQNAQQGASPASLLQQPAATGALNTQNFTTYLSSAQQAHAGATAQMVAVQLQRNAAAGVNSMTLQLFPADLGRLDVKLKFAKDGTVKAHMTVDKPETLALLQKDSHHLQRALQQSGLDADESSLSFDLRQQNREQDFESFRGGRNAHAYGASDDAGNDNTLTAQVAVHAAGYISASGVNIMV